MSLSIGRVCHSCVVCRLYYTAPVYEFATLKQGLFWSNYWYHSLAGETPVSGPSELTGQNRNFSWVAMCCSFALCCAKWHIRFHFGDKQMLEINQVRGTIEVQKGMDLVAAVCISYVFDQFTRHPLNCKEAASRSNSARDNDDNE